MSRAAVDSLLLAATAFVVVVALEPAVLAQPDPTKAPPATETAEPAIDPAKLAGDNALRVRDARNRVASANNLKQLGIAVHEYHTTYRKLPGDIVGKDGKPLLSWRVLLLPYVEELALYKQFRLDEPWDSKHNLPLLEKMPAVLRSPRVALKGKGYTVYQGFSGQNAVFRPGQPALTIAGFPDGLSNTILTVEATTAVPWSKPADIPFDPAKAVPGFGKALGDMPLAALMEGSVRTLDLKKLSAETLKRAIDPADGQPLGNDW
jgi:Protein of unknown function (DUF1559)